MNQSFNRVIGLFLVLILYTAGFAQNSRSVAKNDTDRTKSAAKGITADTIEKDISESLSVIESNYVGGKTLNYNDVVKTSIDSMLHTLDPHSNYFDAKEYEHYLSWSRDWIGAVHRVLKPDGTFWLAIGDEYAAELKLIFQELGLTCRNWLIWYWT